MVSFVFYGCICKEINRIVNSIGFKKYGRFFYRITADGVVQQFCVLYLRGRFTIRFTLNSIYGDNDKTKEGSELRRIIDGTNQWIGDGFDMRVINGMSVYNHNTVSYEEAVRICKNVLNEVLLPYFEKTKCAKNAHELMLENDSLVNKNIVCFDSREIGFYLLEENYDKAKNVLEYYIENKDKWNKKWWNEKEIEYRKLYDAIKNSDMNYIQEYKKAKKRKACSEFGLAISSDL